MGWHLVEAPEGGPLIHLRHKVHRGEACAAPTGLEAHYVLGEVLERELLACEEAQHILADPGRARVRGRGKGQGQD